MREEKTVKYLLNRNIHINILIRKSCPSFYNWQSIDNSLPPLDGPFSLCPQKVPQSAIVLAGSGWRMLGHIAGPQMIFIESMRKRLVHTYHRK